MPTDYDALTTREVADLITAIAFESAVLDLGTTMRMSAGQESIPVVSFLPVAGFTNARYGGRKPATKIEWSADELVPREIACTFAIPRPWVDDASFDVWGQAKALAASAIARVLDDAVLFGNGAPAEFPAGGVAAAAGAAVTGADPLAAISAAMGAVENSGLVPNGIASGSTIGAALRDEYRAVGALPGEAPTPTIYGLPVEVTPIWDATDGDALVGDWTKLLIGIREDVTYDTSEEAVLQDAAGVIIANAFQDNLVAMRVYMRVGVVLGIPIMADGTGPSRAFAMADWTATP